MSRRSRRIRSLLLCLAASAILPLVLPGVASGTPASVTSGGKLTGGTAASAPTTADGTSGIPTRFAGGCESRHHSQPSSLTDLRQQT